MSCVCSNSTSDIEFELTQSLQLPKPCRCYIDDIIVPHSWLNTVEHSNRIYIKPFHADINDEVADDVVWTVKNYTGNALAGEMKQQLGANFQVIHYADTLQMEITSQNQESFNIYSGRELFEGVTTVTPHDTNGPNTWNALIRNYKPNKANTFAGGIIDLRRFSNIDLTRNHLSCFTVIGLRGQARIINNIPCNGESGATLYHNITTRHAHIDVSHKMLKQYT